MKNGPFKMKGFGGFKSDSPVKNDFNMIGDKASTTPGYKSTKIAKAKTTNKIKDYLMNVPSASSKIVKGLSTAGKVARVLSKASGAGLVAELGYRAYKSGQKHSGGKVSKNQKTNVFNLPKSIFKK